MGLTGMRMIGIVCVVLSVVMLLFFGFGIFGFLLMAIFVTLGIVLYITGKPWPIQVRLFQERDDGHSVYSETLGRRITKDGKEWYQIKGVKDKIKPPEYTKIKHSKGRNYLFLYSNDGTSFVPMTISKSELKVIDQDMKFWYSEQLRRAYEEFASKSSLEKYLPYLLIGMMMVIFAIVVVIMMQGVADVTSSIGGVSYSNRQVLEKAIQILERIQSSGAVPQIIEG